MLSRMTASAPRRTTTLRGMARGAGRVAGNAARSRSNTAGSTLFIWPKASRYSVSRPQTPARLKMSSIRPRFREFTAAAERNRMRAQAVPIRGFSRRRRATGSRLARDGKREHSLRGRTVRPPNSHRGCVSGGGRWPLPGETDRGRTGRGMGRHFPRRPCGAGGRPRVAERRQAAMVADSDGTAGQRPVARPVRAAGARPLRFRDRGVDRSVRDLAARLPGQAGGAPECRS